MLVILKLNVYLRIWPITKIVTLYSRVKKITEPSSIIIFVCDSKVEYAIMEMKPDIGFWPSRSYQWDGKPIEKDSLKKHEDKL